MSDGGKIDGIIIDLDGTLCDDRHRFHLIDSNTPKEKQDYNRYRELACDDTVNEAVRAVVQMGIETGKSILYLTGRVEEDRKLTKDWLLANHLYVHDVLMMRDNKDVRSNAQVKEDMYHDLRRTHNIMLAIDDNPKVIALWKRLGVPVLGCIR